MIGISLRWNVTKHEALADVLAEIEAADFPFVEVCGLDEVRAVEFGHYVKQGWVRAYSIHNPCPDASAFERKVLVPGDWLAASDPQKRAAALFYAKKTIDFAVACDIRHIVYHLGRVEIVPRDQELAAIIRSGGRGSREYESLRDTYRREREKLAPLHIELARDSLEELIRYSNGAVTLCLENRYRFDQIPTFEDALFLLEEYVDEPVAYWHDIGHAHAQVFIGLAEPGYLDALTHRLVGIHLHDAIGNGDHKVPGTGEINFARICAQIPKKSINVIELASQVTIEEAAAGRHFLLSIGF